MRVIEPGWVYKGSVSALIAPAPMDSARASFQTHLNYAKRMAHLLDGCKIATVPLEGVVIDSVHVARFRRLYDITRRSIQRDIELAREDREFALIAAPWVPVKCYYALYYLEGILTHALNGARVGFGKGGHAGVRNCIYGHLSSGAMSFSVADLNRVRMLSEVEGMPALDSGRNARGAFWKEDACSDSTFKKLAQYKLYDAKLGRKWNLRTKAHRIERAAFIARERIALLDFFYWYRIKANYRDLDYIDFENGITATEVAEYVEAFHTAYERYGALLLVSVAQVGRAA